jgi:hypothetical protein
MTDRIRELLHRADAAAPEPALLPPDLAPQLRRRARQRRHRRALAALALLLAASSGIFLAYPPRSPGPGTLTSRPSPAPAVHNAPAPEPDLTFDPIADVRNDAALTMVVIARRRARMFDAQFAADTYQRTIDLYPETPWAAVARAELANLPN